VPQILIDKILKGCPLPLYEPVALRFAMLSGYDIHIGLLGHHAASADI
jgi:hypothetical protein